MKWIFNNLPFIIQPPNTFGFVYRIVQKSTGMQYIGKKSFYSKDVKESNWRTYTTSSKFLKPLIELNPNDFDTTILELAKTDKQLTFLERKWINYYGSNKGDDFNRL